jgi:hypothetical protein
VRIVGIFDAVSTGVERLRRLDAVTISAFSRDGWSAQSLSDSSRFVQIESYGRSLALSNGLGEEMLKITITHAARAERWTLHGRLVAPWVSELKASWKREHKRAQGRRCIVNLDEVTFIDKSGERMLRSMSNQGAQFVASDLYLKHVLDRLSCKLK